ncbi:MAG: UDP-N-acetylglucosamine 1-carboxyvinyltransferase [Planctomycetota bacterium]|nr:MAG: UDP-N-acetylglucosamine 1-carboxyvinyltransferase [Planctomycetota bacterium]
MDCFRIEGGRRLEGRTRVSGSKNASLPLLAAALLVDGTVRLRGVPRLRDTDTLLELLAGLGVRWRRSGARDLRLEADPGGPTEAPYAVVRRMRASVCVLGPLLARRGRARVALPGGCVLGPRPIDLHLRGMEALGAEVRIEHGTIVAEAPAGGLRGARVRLAGERGTTVLGTINVLFAACIARGRTVLEAAAQEPEVVAVGEFLNACGARIEGLGGPTLEVEGVEGLGGAETVVPPDRIEAGTLLLAGAISGGRVRVEGCRPAECGPLLSLLAASGVEVAVGPDWFECRPWRRPPRAQGLVTRPYPGFPTDLQAQWMAFSCRCAGVARIREGVYPERFVHAAELVRMGARIQIGEGEARVEGPVRLQGAEVLASDLRASAALVLAALAAEGTTVVRRVYHLDRGYERLEEKLNALGAAVTRRPDPDAP